MKAIEITNQIEDVKSGFYSFVDSHLVANPSVSASDSCILGPYARSTAYNVRQSLYFPSKVFKFHDVIDKYYIVEMFPERGPLVYRRLVSIRSYLKRLEKEVSNL